MAAKSETLSDIFHFGKPQEPVCRSGEVADLLAKGTRLKHIGEFGVKGQTNDSNKKPFVWS